MTNHKHTMTRRTFFRHASAVAALSACGFPELVVGARQQSFQMGLQLYTVREPMAADPVGTIQKIARIGYEDLETFGFDPKQISYYGFPAGKFKQILKAQGLTTTSGHYDLFRYLNEPMPALQAYVDKCIEGAHGLEQKYITWPWLDPESRGIDSFKKLADRLNVIGEQIRNAGLGLAYHNHDF